MTQDPTNHLHNPLETVLVMLIVVSLIILCIIPYFIGRYIFIIGCFLSNFFLFVIDGG